MVPTPSSCTRRGFLGSIAAGAAAFHVPGVFAEELVQTPASTAGPFYPDKLPLDTDNDLLVLNDAITPAVGEVTHLHGRLLDRDGTPIRNALVEIWQVDANGAYLHSGTSNKDRRDGNFQGYGRFVTGLRGEYGFRTVKPVPYPGRTPHIHFKITRRREELLTTQCYVKGHPGNAQDGVLRRIRDEPARNAVLVDFMPVAGSRIGELQARFDIVLGIVEPAG